MKENRPIYYLDHSEEKWKTISYICVVFHANVLTRHLGCLTIAGNEKSTLWLKMFINIRNEAHCHLFLTCLKENAKKKAQKITRK